MEENDKQEEQEDDYALALRHAARRQEITESLSEEARAEIESLLPLVKNKKKMAVIFPIALGIAIAADAGVIVIDVVALAAGGTVLGLPITFILPIIGYIIDLSTAGIIAILFWPLGGNVRSAIMLVDGIATFIKLLPFVINGMIPTYTIGVAIAGRKVYKEAGRAKKQIAELKKVDVDQITEEALEEEFA